MRFIKRYGIALAAAFLVLVVMVSTVLAAWEFNFPTTATDNTGAGRLGYPVMLEYTGQTFIDNGKISANGTDTNMQIGVNDARYMISTDNVVAVVPNLPAFGKVVLDFYTGYTPLQSLFSIVYGDSGNITVSDNVNLELQGNDYSFRFEDAWLNTDQVGSSYVYKEKSFNAWNSGSGNISATTGSANVTAIDAPAGNSSLTGNNVVYLTAHDLAAATGIGANFDIGQQLGFNIFRSAVYFDTSEIPDDAVIFYAILHFRGTVDQSAADFNITIQNGQPAFPSDPLVVGDFDATQYSGDGGSLNTSAFIVGDNEIELNDTGLTWINKTGDTKFILRSDEDINSSAPAGNEFVQGTVANTYLEIFYTELTATDIVSGEYDSFEVSRKDDPGVASYNGTVNIGVSMGSGIIPVRQLQKITLVAPSANATFSDITTLVADWDSKAGVDTRHLVFLINAASPDAVAKRAVEIQFNDDAAANYNHQTLTGENAVDDADRRTGVNYLFEYPGGTDYPFAIPGTTYANAFGGGTILIPHAFNTTNHKAVIAQGGAVEDYVSVVAGRWASNAAIASANLTADTGNFATGSIFILGVVDERYLVEEDLLAAPGTIDFNGISGDGHDLAIIGYPRGTVAAAEDELELEVNADGAGASYNTQRLLGTAAVTSAATANDNLIGWIPADNAVANSFGAFLCFINQYAEATNYPTYLTLNGYHETTGPTSRVGAYSGRYNAAVAALTRVEFYGNGAANLATGTLFSLYRVPRYLIDRQELTAPAATITFNNIPQGYEALQLNVYARTTRAALSASIVLEFNGDGVAANYDFQQLSGAGAAVGANRDLASNIWLKCTGNTEGANEFGGGSILILGYNKTDRTTHATSIHGRTENSVFLTSNRWESLNDITSITLDDNTAANFMAGSVFELVGVMPTSSFMIEVDDEVEAIEAAGNMSSVNNTAEWVLGAGNSIYYADNITLSTNSTLKAYYAPLVMLDAEILPDRAGDDNPGTIWWGSNDEVTIIYGEPESSEATTATANATLGFTMPESVMPATWFASGENVANLPFYDNFIVVANNIGMPVQTLYFWILIGIALLVFLYLVTFTKSAFIGVLAMIIILFVGSSMTIVPMWIPFAILIVDIGIMFLYRQVSY